MNEPLLAYCWTASTSLERFKKSFKLTDAEYTTKFYCVLANIATKNRILGKIGQMSRTLLPDTANNTQLNAIHPVSKWCCTQ